MLVLLSFSIPYLPATASQVPTDCRTGLSYQDATRELIARCHCQKPTSRQRPPTVCFPWLGFADTDNIGECLTYLPGISTRWYARTWLSTSQAARRPPAVSTCCPFRETSCAVWRPGTRKCALQLYAWKPSAARQVTPLTEVYLIRTSRQATAEKDPSKSLVLSKSPISSRV